MSKSFGATRALSSVSLAFYAGDVHVIAGGNGAGKSTLIKIIAGVHSDYEGELVLDGARVRFSDPIAARRAGIATIHQELSLLPNLSIADNLWLGQHGAAWSWLRTQEARLHARSVMKRVGLELDPDTWVERLRLADRQLLEIARALSEEARVLILDEPTSALSEPEAERLFTAIAELSRNGVSLLYISHRQDEIRRLAQRISVLRDGELVLSAKVSELGANELVRALLPAQEQPERADSPGDVRHEVALRVSSLSSAGLEPLHELTFSAQRSEVVGLAGLAGSGATEVLAVLAGEAAITSGSIELFGAAYHPRDPRDALRRGVALLPADRGCSVFPALDVAHNATLSGLARYTRGGWVLRTAEARAVASGTRQLGVKAADIRALAGSLSGGNQQKLALLRCLLSEPRLLLLDDPTRGVDAVAKRDIARSLRERAQSGLTILLASSELEELAKVCDRVLVFFKGRIVAELSGAELERERILQSMMGAA